MKYSNCLSKGSFIKAVITFTLLALIGWSCNDRVSQTRTKLKVGAYYFDGWAKPHQSANDPNEPWAKNASSKVSRRMVEEFGDREPVWGWRDDSQSIMEKQIDLAADNGIKFFAFCWFWSKNNGPIDPEAIEKFHAHTSMNLYLKAKNKNRIKYCLLVCNHQGFEIKGTDNWKSATEYLMQYFNDPQYVKVDGKPLVIIFGADGIDNDGLAAIQEVSKSKGLKNGLSIAGCGNTANKSFNYKTRYAIMPGYTSAESEEHKYAELVEAHEKQWIGTEEQPYIPVATVGFDKRPWENKTGSGQSWYYNPDRTPEQFKSMLTDAITLMDEHPTQTTKERILLIYAWNELGEGGYMVPTKGDPEASYLKVVKSVVSGK
jgi:hypothetical protein